MVILIIAAIKSKLSERNAWLSPYYKIMIKEGSISIRIKHSKNSSKNRISGIKPRARQLIYIYTYGVYTYPRSQCLLPKYSQTGKKIYSWSLGYVRNGMADRDLECSRPSPLTNGKVAGQHEL